MEKVFTSPSLNNVRKVLELMKTKIFIVFIQTLVYLISNQFIYAQSESISDNDIIWLKSIIHPLKTFDPTIENTEDLEILGQLVGDKKIVALGEVTHGSSEIFKMKHRIIKYLNKQHNFDIFSMEAAMPEADRLNEYILDGKGNPTELIRGMHFWILCNQEVLDLVEWMRLENQNGHPIKFCGFDMQYYEGAIENLKNGFKYDSKITQTIDELNDTLNLYKLRSNMPIIGFVSEQQENTVNQFLKKIEQEVNLKNFGKSEKEWLLRNLRIIEQSIKDYPWEREKYMAENFEWITKQNPNSKFIIWAHNSHVMRTNHHETLLPMGGYLSNDFKEDYLNIGFAFYKGSYTALSHNKIEIQTAEEAENGSYEYIFYQLQEPLFLIDLREIRDNNSLQTQLFKNALKFRTVGAVKTREFEEKDILKDYDLLIFIAESTNAIQMKY